MAETPARHARATEIRAQSRRAGEHAVHMGALVPFAAGALAVSYMHILSTLALVDVRGWMAWVTAATVDVVLVVAFARVVLLRRLGEGWAFSGTVAGVLLLVTLAANMGAAGLLPGSVLPLVRLVAYGWPAMAAFVAWGLMDLSLSDWRHARAAVREARAEVVERERAERERAVREDAERAERERERMARAEAARAVRGQGERPAIGAVRDEPDGTVHEVVAASVETPTERRERVLAEMREILAEEETVSIRELARRVGVAPSTARDWLKAGQ